MSSTANAPKIRLTPWPVLHGVLLSVMISSICVGLGAYVTFWVAVPIAISITILFSYIASEITASRHTKTWSRRVLLSVVLCFLFSITGALSYATLYEVLVAHASGTRFLDIQVTSARRKLQSAASAVDSFVNTTSQLGEYSNQKYKKEKESGGSCPGIFNSGNTEGPIATFRLNDSLSAEQISKLVKSSTQPFRENMSKLGVVSLQDYKKAKAASEEINKAIQLFNSLKADASLPVIEASLGSLMRAKILDGRDCGDNARSTQIESARRSLDQIKKADFLEEIRPGIDLDDKKSITSVSLLRGLTLVASIPPISFFSSLIGVNTSFDNDPLMKAGLKAKGTLNDETLPLAVCALLELMILLTARLAHGTGDVAFPTVTQSFENRVNSISGISGLSTRAVLNLIFRSIDPNRASSEHAQFNTARPFSHTAADPTFAQREKEFAVLLLQWVVDLDWDTYLIIPDILLKERDHHAAGVLAYERLATVVALHVPWSQLTAIAYAIERKANEGRYGGDYQNRSFHVYRLSEHFSQLLRLELLSPSVKSKAPSQANVTGAPSVPHPNS